jgi:hypothetical protein
MVREDERKRTVWGGGELPAARSPSAGGVVKAAIKG